MTMTVKRSLAGWEEIIEDRIRSFAEIGEALRAIRDQNLYQEKHETFEQYCRDRWGISRPRAYQLIESAVVISDLRLSTIVDTGSSKTGEKDKILPANEAQARVIAEAAPDAKTRQKIWNAAVVTAPKDDDGKPRITAAVVKKAAEAIVGKPESNGYAGREPGDDALQPEHDESIHDELGGPVPAGLRDVFSQATEFRSIIQSIGALKARIGAMMTVPAGAALQGHVIDGIFRDLKAAVKFAQPHTECPRCRRKIESDCKVCVGSGWVTRMTLDRSASDADLKWLKGRK